MFSKYSSLVWCDVIQIVVQEFMICIDILSEEYCQQYSLKICGIYINMYWVLMCVADINVY